MLSPTPTSKTTNLIEINHTDAMKQQCCTNTCSKNMGTSCKHLLLNSILLKLKNKMLLKLDH